MEVGRHAGSGAAPDAKKPEYTEPNPGPYRERFNNMDANSDDFLTREEMVNNKQLSEQLSTLDTNKDDKLDVKEFSAFETKAPSASDRSPED